MPRDPVQVALRRLYDAGYVDGFDVTSMGPIGFEIMNLKLLEPALRVVGIWPSVAYDELLATLERRIEQEPDPDRRGKLERLRDGVLDVGKSVATSVITEVVKKSAGL